MVSIYKLAGYKYIGDRPEAPIGVNMGLFRDNLTYICASFSEWSEDRKMLMFMFEEHLSYLDIEIFDKLFASHLSNNAIPRMHIVLKEHTDETNGQTALMVSKGGAEESIFLQIDGAPVDILTVIARKKRFYHKELPVQKELAWKAATKPKAKRAARKKPVNPTDEATT
jgi:hypothetical protein